MKKFRLEFAIIVTSILLMALYFSDTTITGFASTQVFYKNIDLSVDNSQSFVLKGLQSLRSFTLTGEIVGAGAVLVVLDDGAGSRKVVYSNDGGSSQFVSTKDVGYESSIELVPQYALAGYAEHERVKLTEGLFESCGEACALNSWTAKEFILSVYVEPGTKLVLRKITYT
ncbi:MAG: hypothetical protein HY363_05035 [Candidatus Aenigmarchaeota archaeon]|nr:hypothetical protein [Candidatus Aenigmarchaeota archaeon]